MESACFKQWIVDLGVNQRVSTVNPWSYPFHTYGRDESKGVMGRPFDSLLNLLFTRRPLDPKSEPYQPQTKCGCSTLQWSWHTGASCKRGTGHLASLACSMGRCNNSKMLESKPPQFQERLMNKCSLESEGFSEQFDARKVLTDKESIIVKITCCHCIYVHKIYPILYRRLRT